MGASRAQILRDTRPAVAMRQAGFLTSIASAAGAIVVYGLLRDAAGVATPGATISVTLSPVPIASGAS